MKPFTVETIKEIMYRKRRIDENGCWIWTGIVDSHGYGSMMRYGKRRSISRMSLHIFKGMSLLSPNDACHTPECKSRLCFNPDHLYEGSRSQNIKDAVRAGTHRSGFKRKD